MTDPPADETLASKCFTMRLSLRTTRNRVSARRMLNMEPCFLAANSLNCRYMSTFDEGDWRSAHSARIKAIKDGCVFQPLNVPCYQKNIGKYQGGCKELRPWYRPSHVRPSHGLPIDCNPIPKLSQLLWMSRYDYYWYMYTARPGIFCFLFKSLDETFNFPGRCCDCREKNIF